MEKMETGNGDRKTEKRWVRRKKAIGGNRLGAACDWNTNRRRQAERAQSESGYLPGNGD